MDHKNDSNTHDINLNIHYSVSNELWNKVIDVFSSMPYWVEDKKIMIVCFGTMRKIA